MRVARAAWPCGCRVRRADLFPFSNQASLDATGPARDADRGEDQQRARGLGDGGLRAEQVAGTERRALRADVEIDDAVIIDVDLTVVVEVAVEPATRS